MIPFTRYLRPDGRTDTSGGFERPADVEEVARRVIAHGWRFECELLTTGEVSLTVFDPGEEVDVACEIAPNGPGIGEVVDRLVSDAAGLIDLVQEISGHTPAEEPK